MYDTNGDGYIDFTEFMTIFYIMSEGTPEDVLAGIFRMFDYNSDGTITEECYGYEGVYSCGAELAGDLTVTASAVR